MGGLGFHPTIIERPRNKLEAIAAARTALARCQFDEQGCDLGLRRLRAYRKEWDETRGVWKDRPRLARGGRLPDLRLQHLHAAGVQSTSAVYTSCSRTSMDCRALVSDEP